MKKLLWLMLLFAFVTPMFGSVLPGLGPATAHAQDEDGDSQGSDSDSQT